MTYVVTCVCEFDFQDYRKEPILCSSLQTIHIFGGHTSSLCCKEHLRTIMTKVNAKLPRI